MTGYIYNSGYWGRVALYADNGYYLRTISFGNDIITKVEFIGGMIHIHHYDGYVTVINKKGEWINSYRLS